MYSIKSREIVVRGLLNIDLFVGSTHQGGWEGGDYSAIQIFYSTKTKIVNELLLLPNPSFMVSFIKTECFSYTIINTLK